MNFRTILVWHSISISLYSYYSRPAEVLYGESSMRNGFGLRLLHKFLGLPFLRLQKETLLSQLQRNQRETQSCSMELSDFLVSILPFIED